MFLLRNKKDISIFRMKKAPYLLLYLYRDSPYTVVYFLAGGDDRYALNPHFKNLCLFYEYFHGDTGRGCGARYVKLDNFILICRKNKNEAIAWWRILL